jgi:hypothetical protein
MVDVSSDSLKISKRTLRNKGVWHLVRMQYFMMNCLHVIPDSLPSEKKVKSVAASSLFRYDLLLLTYQASIIEQNRRD